MSDEPKAPQPPEELWMLWDEENREWFCHPGMPMPMATFLDKEEADFGANHYGDDLGRSFTPVRVK